MCLFTTLSKYFVHRAKRSRHYALHCAEFPVLQTRLAVSFAVSLVSYLLLSSYHEVVHLPGFFERQSELTLLDCQVI